MCGYSRCQAALEFHHLDPSEKDFGLSTNKTTKSLVKLIDELRKCILVCANCHREIHSGMIENEALTSHQIIDDDVIRQYTTDADGAKQQGRIERESAQLNKQQLTAVWKELHPHSDHRIKKVDWSQHDVSKLLEEYKSYEAVGRLLGVTGAAIKRRVRYLESKQ